VLRDCPKRGRGKYSAGTIRKIANGEDWQMPATIDDPVILDEITEGLKTLGFAQGV
jgi:propionyl-CoA synthetase